MECSCANPDFCPIFQMKMTGRPYAICRGENVAPQTREKYLTLWANRAKGGVVLKPSPPTFITCQHRGEEIEQRQCQSCGGKVMVKVFGCGIHGTCSLQKNVGTGKLCKYCPDLSPIPSAPPSTDCLHRGMTVVAQAGCCGDTQDVLECNNGSTNYVQCVVQPVPDRDYDTLGLNVCSECSHRATILPAVPVEPHKS